MLLIETRVLVSLMFLMLDQLVPERKGEAWRREMWGGIREGLFGLQEIAFVMLSHVMVPSLERRLGQDLAESTSAVIIPAMFSRRRSRRFGDLSSTPSGK